MEGLGSITLALKRESSWLTFNEKGLKSSNKEFLTIVRFFVLCLPKVMRLEVHFFAQKISVFPLDAVLSRFYRLNLGRPERIREHCRSWINP